MTAVRIFAALIFSLSLNASGAPFAVQLGEAKIGLDAPPGFADTGFTGSPRLQELGESLTSASNRILLFAISDADLRRFMVGDPLELRRYMIAVTPRGTERERMSENAFKLFIAESLRDFGMPPAGADYPKYLDTRPIGASSPLAELKKEPDVVSMLHGTRTKGGFFGRSKYLLSSTTLILLRGKPLNLSVYTQYDDAADLEWIRLTTARWIEDLKRLNSR
jgi:hypothetical protein